MRKNILFVSAILLLPTIALAAINEVRQVQPEKRELQKSDNPNNVRIEVRNSYGLENGYGYGPIDKNLEAKGYGNAFAYGQDKEKNGNAYGLEKKDGYGKENNKNLITDGYGYGKKQKVNLFTNVFTRIKNFFSFKKNK